MLQKRLVACLTIKNGIVVQSIGFKKYLPVGRLDIAVEFLSRWGIDEIAIVDIDATGEKRGPNIELIQKSISKNFAPLGIGGGIRTIHDMRIVNYLGAEKAIINSIFFDDPQIVTQAAEIFGSQFVVVSLDVKKHPDGRYEIYSHGGEKAQGIDPVSAARKAQSLGAGEIFLTSIDHDGSKQGYDIELIRSVSSSISIPLIACGGVGCPEHFLKGFENGAQAAAAGNFFHFIEHSPIIAKRRLLTLGCEIRLDTYATYEGAAFDNHERLAKRTEEYLERMRFQYLPDEII